MKRLVVLVAAVSAGCLIAEPPDVPRDARVGRQACPVVPTELEFGEVLGSVAGFVEIANPSPDRSLLASFSAVEAPFEIISQLVSVPAGGRQRVQVTFRPFDGLTHIARTTVTSNGCEPREIELRGSGQGDLLVESRMVIPPTPLGETREVEVQLINTRRVALTIAIRTLTNAPHFTFPSAVTVGASASVSFPVQFRAVTPDEEALTLFLTADGVMRPIVIDAKAGLPRVRVERTRLVLDPFPITAFGSQRSFVIANDGAVSLALSAPRVRLGPGALPGEFGVVVKEATAIAPGASTSVVVEIFPTHLGPAEWTVSLDTDDPLRPTISLVVVAEFANVRNCAREVIATPFFYDVRSPWPQTAQLQFTNAGTTACLVTDVRLTPASWSTDLGELDGFLLPAMSSRAVNVTVTHAGEGSLVFGVWPDGAGMNSIRGAD